ncbi:hypothetical protein Cadr_000014738 [Camelus dromedarius]|uniref:Uncharacterized protein n=1 Tax=Camelus dromedarius TaxID=9838 RepID=A0A5N4DND3_CAMDR|nr:hypothetical protein Cadr_000014738 [Camelus dromedarius]
MQTTLQSRIGWTRAEPQPHAPEQPCLRDLLHSSEVVVLKVWSGGPLGQWLAAKLSLRERQEEEKSLFLWEGTKQRAPGNHASSVIPSVPPLDPSHPAVRT